MQLTTRPSVGRVLPGARRRNGTNYGCAEVGGAEACHLEAWDLQSREERDARAGRPRAGSEDPVPAAGTGVERGLHSDLAARRVVAGSRDPGPSRAPGAHRRARAHAGGERLVRLCAGPGAGRDARAAARRPSRAARRVHRGSLRPRWRDDRHGHGGGRGHLRGGAARRGRRGGAGRRAAGRRGPYRLCRAAPAGTPRRADARDGLLLFEQRRDRRPAGDRRRTAPSASSSSTGTSTTATAPTTPSTPPTTSCSPRSTSGRCTPAPVRRATWGRAPARATR